MSCVAGVMFAIALVPEPVATVCSTLPSALVTRATHGSLAPSMLSVKLPEPFVVVAPLPVEHLASTARLAIGFAEPSVAVPLSASAVEAGGAALSEEPPPQPAIVAEAAAATATSAKRTRSCRFVVMSVPVVGLRPLAPRRAGGPVQRATGTYRLSRSRASSIGWRRHAS